MKIYISAMSDYQKEIRRGLVGKGKQVLRHVICLVLYPNSVDYNHWKDEIVGFIEDVDMLKGKNRWPKKSFIKEAISVQNDMISAVIKQVKLKKKGLVPRKVDDREILKAAEAYQDWLAEQLSKEGIIDPDEGRDLLDNIVANVQYDD